MLTKHDVLAVVITYNPDKDIRENIKAMLDQRLDVIIIDNGSENNFEAFINDLKLDEEIEIIKNYRNMGIAYALNQGLKIAKARKYKLILTMDQDSLLLNNSIDEMLKILNKEKKLVSVGANYRDKDNELRDGYCEAQSLITSGNLTYVDMAIKIGGFTDVLFIDSVDFDFSLRLRKMGGKLGIISNAGMEHRLGEQYKIEVFGFNLCIDIHSPLRHYYMFRNHHYIVKEFIKVFPKFCIKKTIIMWKYFFEILLFHPNKKENIYMIYKGISHGIQGKHGEYKI